MQIREKFRELDRKQQAALGVLVFLLSGFLWAGLVNFFIGGGQACTLMACQCQSVDIDPDNPPERLTNNYTEPVTGDIECNECGGHRLLYHAGFFWVAQETESTQMYVCRDGEKVGEYYRTDGYGEIKTGNIFTGRYDLGYVAEILGQLSQGILNP
jgi:hypothetical protein